MKTVVVKLDKKYSLKFTHQFLTTVKQDAYKVVLLVYGEEVPEYEYDIQGQNDSWYSLNEFGRIVAKASSPQAVYELLCKTLNRAMKRKTAELPSLFSKGMYYEEEAYGSATKTVVRLFKGKRTHTVSLVCDSIVYENEVSTETTKVYANEAEARHVFETTFGPKLKQLVRLSS